MGKHVKAVVILLMLALMGTMNATAVPLEANDPEFGLYPLDPEPHVERWSRIGGTSGPISSVPSITINDPNPPGDGPTPIVHHDPVAGTQLVIDIYRKMTTVTYRNGSVAMHDCANNDLVYSQFGAESIQIRNLASQMVLLSGRMKKALYPLQREFEGMLAMSDLYPDEAADAWQNFLHDYGAVEIVSDEDRETLALAVIASGFLPDTSLTAHAPVSSRCPGTGECNAGEICTCESPVYDTNGGLIDCGSTPSTCNVSTPAAISKILRF